jgi:hypothetical protein
MRLVQNEQMKTGEVDISKINFDLNSRDDIPKILRGLQYIYITEAIRTLIFNLYGLIPRPLGRYSDV